jgi:hypothetical protein
MQLLSVVAALHSSDDRHSMHWQKGCQPMLGAQQLVC